MIITIRLLVLVQLLVVHSHCTVVVDVVVG